jgi:hypothetical protein
VLFLRLLIKWVFRIVGFIFRVSDEFSEDQELLRMLGFAFACCPTDFCTNYAMPQSTK